MLNHKKMYKMLQQHREARESIATLIHEFKSCYKNGANTIYAFFEGKEDSSFYINAIQNSIPEKWSIRTWVCGNKEKVYNTYNSFDWNKYPKTAVIFFVDKDLSDYLGEYNYNDYNIYMTRYYSIENYLVNAKICLRILKELYGFSNLTPIEENIILNLFEKQLNIFYNIITNIMGWYMCCRKNILKPNLNDIKLNNLINFKKGEIIWKNAMKNTNIVKYCDLKCKTDIYYKESKNIKGNISELKKNKNPKKYIRGKYELWFLIEFTRSVHLDCSNIFNSIMKKPKIRVQLGQHNAMEIIGPRVRIPRSLKKFLEKTCEKHVILLENNN